MKILFLGDASNYHCALASALRRLGHDVTLASDGCGSMLTHRDIDISRHPSPIGGVWLWLKLNTLLSADLKGYDIVQLCSPFFIALRPERLLKILHRLKENNGRVFLTDLGNTPHYVEMCVDPESPLIYNEWRNPSIARPEDNPQVKAWLAPGLKRYCRELYSKVDGITTALYEYHIADKRYVDPARLHYLGIPIDLPSLPRPSNPNGPVRILSACDAARADHKGAGILRDLAARVVADNPGRAVLRQVHNIPYSQFLAEVAAADIVLDQLYSYTPATTALLTMAMEGVSVSGGEEDYYRFIGEHKLRPVVNASPLNLAEAEARLRNLVTDSETLNGLKRQGREFVELYHSADYLALSLIDIWTSY